MSEEEAFRWLEGQMDVDVSGGVSAPAAAAAATAPRSVKGKPASDVSVMTDDEIFDLLRKETADAGVSDYLDAVRPPPSASKVAAAGAAGISKVSEAGKAANEPTATAKKPGVHHRRGPAQREQELAS